MNDREMMEQRVEDLREFLTKSHLRVKTEEIYRRDILIELLDTRRQLHRLTQDS